MKDRAPDAKRPAWEDQWLLEAFRRIGHPAATRASHVGAATAWEALVASGVPDSRVLETACATTSLPAANLASVGRPQMELIPLQVAQRYGVVPVRLENGIVDVACANPLRTSLEQDLGFATGRRVRLLIASPASVASAQWRIYGDAAGVRTSGGGEEVTGGVIEALDRIIAEGLKQRASDIHIEPKDSGLLVRLRIDGVLADVLRIPEEISSPLISRLKVLARLDIADRIRPQDGRATTQFQDRSIDLRISTLPLGGSREKVVIRILDAASSTVSLDALGFTPPELHRVHKLLGLTEGMVLVTGPTGSGKTTTLYSALRAVQSTENNIVTVEDPIEYRLDGINQVQVNEKAGLTFAAALRSILRQDPDVVLVGEIRDGETAGIAIKAAMTGHIVLSTLHTNDAPSAVARLADIGVDMGALAGALKGIMAQRLVRRLCDHCSEPVSLADLPMDQQMLLMGKKADRLKKAVGCDQCRGTGFNGRMVVAEIMVVTPEMMRAIAQGASVSELTDLGKQGGMLTLWEAGLERVLNGTTSLHELLDNVAAPIENAEAAQSDVDALLATLLAGGGSAPAAAAPASAPPAPAIPAPAAEAQGVAPPRAGPATTTPSATVPSRAAPPRPTLGARPGGEGPRVLVVDDDRAARVVLRAALEQEGCRVIEAADGEAGLSYARKLRPDLVITEIAIPRLDGIGLLQDLRADPAAPPVLVYTGQTDPALLAWTVELGALDVVTKPADARALLGRFRAKAQTAA